MPLTPFVAAPRKTLGFRLVALLLAVAFPFAAVADKKNTADPTVITNARTAHSLSATEAARKHPVHLRAVVTYYDPYVHRHQASLFVCDPSGCIFAALPVQPILPLQAGTLVDLQGVSGAGNFAPIIEEPKVHVLGQSHTPRNPRRVNVTELLTGARWTVDRS